MKYKAVIFDMDGTILNTLEDLKNATNYALKANGFPQRSLEEVRWFVGNGIEKLVKRALPENFTKEEKDITYKSFMAYYTKHCADNTSPYQGIRELLVNLRNMGIKTAVVSNKTNQAVGQLVEEYFDGLFDGFAGEQEGMEKKPAPDMVNHILMKLGLSKEEAVYVGDSEVDIETAQNSHLDLIGVSWGFRGRAFLEKNGCEIVVDSPAEIQELVEKKGKKIAIVFPGIGYTSDKPLLYYGTKLAWEYGYEECIKIAYPKLDKTNIRGNKKAMQEVFENLYRETERQLSAQKWQDYESILFISKSIGTKVAAAYEVQNKVKDVKHIFYTPLSDTFSYRVKNAVAFIGTNDGWSDYREVERGARQNNINLHIYDNCNHSLETGNICDNIDRLGDVITKTEEYLKNSEND